MLRACILQLCQLWMEFQNENQKVIPNECSEDQFMIYDAFFIEVNISKLDCKSPKPYRFSHVFKREGKKCTKILYNEPVDRYYIDKIALMDLIEFYDIEYEFIRGYYFDEGFNNKINDFVNTLFDLRLKDKDEKNPLQKTI